MMDNNPKAILSAPIGKHCPVTALYAQFFVQLLQQYVALAQTLQLYGHYKQLFGGKYNVVLHYWQTPVQSHETHPCVKHGLQPATPGVLDVGATYQYKPNPGQHALHVVGFTEVVVAEAEVAAP